MSKCGTDDHCRPRHRPECWLELLRESHILLPRVTDGTLWSTRRIRLRDYTTFGKCAVIQNSILNPMRLRDMDSRDTIVRWVAAAIGLTLTDSLDRNTRYPPPQRLAHPKDCSVMTYRGHQVSKTLIRCHFSPRESTGQNYIYSGRYVLSTALSRVSSLCQCGRNDPHLVVGR
jgi:hypothetical protein